MKRLLAGVLTLAALTLWLGRSAEAQGDKAPTLRDAMKKLNGGTTGLYFALGQELRDPETSWADARRLSKEVVRLTAVVPKSTPPKGDKASWDKLAKAYADNAVALDDAVGRMNKAAAQAAYQKMGEPNCMTCHKAHRKD